MAGIVTVFRQGTGHDSIWLGINAGLPWPGSQRTISAGLTSHRELFRRQNPVAQAAKQNLSSNPAFQYGTQFPKSKPTPRAAPAKMNCSLSRASPSAVGAVPRSALRPEFRG